MKFPTLSKICTAYPCEIIGSTDAEIEKLEYNSKKASPGTLFFCLPGARVDGHEFAPLAYEAGCRHFVVERILPLPDDAVQVKVAKSREALAYMSAEFYDRPADRLQLIGITGTKGKTTTSIMIKEALQMNGIRSAYIGSNGVIIGDDHYATANTTPESRDLHYYFSVMEKTGITHVVMEVSSQALNNYRTAGLKFDTVIYTNLSTDHIGPGEHSSFDDYRDAKRKLFTDYDAKNVIYNTDDQNHAYMIRDVDANLISYGTGSGADFSASHIQPYRDETTLGIEFDVMSSGRTVRSRLRSPGEFSAYNGLAAIAALSCCGIPTQKAVDALAKISIQGRFEIVEATPGITFIIDYAHNGFSLENALSVLRRYDPKRLICVFGSVGGRTYGRRRELAEAASKYADYSIITSDNPDYESPESVIDDILKYFDKSKIYTTVPDREEAVRLAVRIASEGDIILFAGKGHETYQLVCGEKLPFSERAIILDEALALKMAIK
ncbi:MAG: UDP-N-acetylmuramoyl-L-alanyl-D-glutamate--2,6-diaminopimelate ligase [Clostridia bacterium]|nr:UDP-N-acetylmuramoyl-L-alanyl-D-glutamate--2,6-diaminopimelate ligase [Clostridia bacterium]